MLLLNAQSLTVDKINLLEAEYLQESDSINFICLTEVWYGNKYPATFPGFRRVSEFNRLHGRGGGLTIWARQHLDVEGIDVREYCLEKYFEACAIKCRHNNKTVVIILCYRSQGHLDIGVLCNGLNNILHQLYKPTIEFIILGDFNADPVRDRKCFRLLRDTMLTFGLYDIVSSPTRGDYMLDHVFRNQGSCLVIENTISDHRTLFCESGLQLRPRRSNDLYTRSYGPQQLTAFTRSLREEDWGVVFRSAEVDEAYDAFSLALTYHYEYNFPIKKRTVIDKRNNNWVNDEIRASSSYLRDLFHAQKKHDCLKEVYKQARRCHLLLIRDTKKQFYQNMIFSSNNIQRNSWRVVNALSGREPKRANIVHISDPNDGLITDHKVMATYFNYYFRDAPCRVVGQIPPVASTVAYSGKRFSDINFFLLPYSEEELLSLCRRRLRSGGSVGADGFQASVVKQTLDLLAKPLTYLVNLSFETGRFPKALKISKIIPIHKKGPKDLAENYRPIAITSVFSKIFEYCFLDRLDSFLSKYNVIKPNQFGFRGNCSTTDAVYDFVKSISTHLEAGECPVGVFCDLSRAFDCVNHKMLLDKLSDYGIRGTPLEWLSSFLAQRCQFVEIRADGCFPALSDRLNIVMGLPQGTVLSPVLFSLYINDMADDLDPACASTLYADDVSFSISNLDDDVLQYNCNNNLFKLLQWYNLNSLYLNASKTYYIRFHNRQKECKSLDLSVADFSISMKDSVRFLGVEIDQYLNWKMHCENLATKLNSSCFLFKSLRHLLNRDQLVALYHAQVGSRARYAILLWGNSPAAKDVFLSQKRVIRSMLGLRPIDSCRQAFKSLKILTIASLYILELNTYVYKHRSEFVTNRTVHSIDTRNKNNFHLQFFRLEISKNLPRSIGLKVFNELPEHIKSLPTLTKFKRGLNNYLLDHSFYSLREYSSSLVGEW